VLALAVINPSRIRILAVGKVRKGWLNEGVALYRKRLPGLEVVELRDGGMAREAEAIRAALRPEEQLVALTEEGRSFSSEGLARQLQGSGSGRLAFVIGGADGLDPALRAEARWQLSLSPLTFPHELARLLLLEQLYRALSIQQGGPYHRA
jgi:23S rRNA (pseudouridine1915-N3)-methyltransferase